MSCTKTFKHVLEKGRICILTKLQRRHTSPIKKKNWGDLSAQENEVCPQSPIFEKSQPENGVYPQSPILEYVVSPHVHGPTTRKVPLEGGQARHHRKCLIKDTHKAL